MAFLSKLLARLFPTPSMDPPRPPPPPPEPIEWPQADASRLPDGDVPPAGSTSDVAPEIAGEIREDVQQARIEEASSTILFQRHAPEDPLFSDFRTDCKPRAFTDRVRLGVREVYGGDAVPFYRAAGISRSAYSRLISHPERRPSKDTALAMAAALKLDEEGAEAFLELAGYALSPSYPEDAVWRICFRRGVHDLATIRAFLAEVRS